VEFARKEDSVHRWFGSRERLLPLGDDLSRHPNVTRKPMGTNHHTDLNRRGGRNALGEFLAQPLDHFINGTPSR
jgi:hypothetical protein